MLDISDITKMSEEYIFLGEANDTFFFLLNVSNNNFDKKISHEIYNILLKDKRLEHSEQNVIIYEINTICSECSKCLAFNIVSIQHSLKDNNKIVKYNLENLSEYFMILLNAKSKDLTIKKDLFVIKYNYLDKSYGTIETTIETKYNCDIIKLFNNIPNIAPPFSNIDLVYTSFVG
jgi:hypothetical protein